MNLKQEINNIKILWTQGSQLLLLRLRLLRLDATEQLASLIKILAAIFGIMVLLLVGLIALLFGLNTLLQPEMKIWVFFGCSALCGLIIVGLWYWIFRLWRNSHTLMGETLHALQNDLRLLNGSGTNQETTKNEEKSSI